MEQAPAIWLLILLAVLTANLPFVSQRRFLIMPWTADVPARPWWLQTGLSLLFFFLLWAWLWLVQILIADALYAGDWLSVVMRLAGVGLAACALVWWPGLLLPTGDTKKKSFVQHILEVLLLYFMVGAVGLALESSMSNPFLKGWEFYVITLSLYLVLGYPGFVYRYLLKHRKRP